MMDFHGLNLKILIEFAYKIIYKTINILKKELSYVWILENEQSVNLCEICYMVVEFHLNFFLYNKLWFSKAHVKMKGTLKNIMEIKLYIFIYMRRTNWYILEIHKDRNKKRFCKRI
jgi:hypothetical protein